MKLYVVGSNSPDPEKWTYYGSISLVMAENTEQARELADHYGEYREPVCEIPMTGKQCLLTKVN